MIAGNQLTYTITVSNAGPSDAQSVSLFDNLPSQLQNPTYCIGSGCTPSTPWPASNTLALGTITADPPGSVQITAKVRWCRSLREPTGVGVEIVDFADGNGGQARWLALLPQ